MLFVIVMHQQGGCDYTIGCGCKVEYINAASYEEAELIAIGMCSSYTGERKLSGMLVGQLPWSVNIDVNQVYANLEAEKDRRKKAELEAAERQQYERLKKKFEGK